MLITNSNSLQGGVRKRTISRVVNIGPLSLRFITLVMFAALALFYLAQSTQSATKWANVRELELEKNELIKEKERLNIEVDRLKALKEIQGSVERLQLEQNN